MSQRGAYGCADDAEHEARKQYEHWRAQGLTHDEMAFALTLPLLLGISRRDIIAQLKHAYIKMRSLSQVGDDDVEEAETQRRQQRRRA